MGYLTIKLAVLLLCLGYAKNSKLDSASSKLLFRNNDGCSGLKASGSSHCNWYYLAYAPRILRAGSTEKVLVITYNVKFDVTVSVKIVGTRHGEIAAGESVVKPGVLTEIPVKIPQNVPTSCTIKVYGSAEVPAGTDGILQDAIWVFQNETESIKIERTSTSVFIQTDRPIYKPGETMRMRVVAVDSNLKAAKGVASRVSVLNPTQSLMRQWKEVKLRNGIASLKLKLSIKPVLGKWKVQATVNGVTKTVTVKVEKYVLPKFQVTVSPPPYIALGQHKVYAEVCAKYSYGKKVNGFMTAEICAKHPGFYRSGWIPAKDYCTLVMRQIYGCEQVEIDLKEYKIYDYSGWGSIRFGMAASVKETATGISLNATYRELTVSSTHVSLSFDQSTPKIFKPGLPFEAGLSASHPDGSSVSDIFVLVTVTVGWSKTLFDKMVKVINGRAKINIPEIPFDAKEVRFSASYERPKVPGSKLRDYKRRTSAYLTSKAWYSPSHSYISIDRPNKVFKVGQKASVKVRYTSVDSSPMKRTVYYTLMCKGYAAHSGSVETEFIAATSRQKRSIVDLPPDDEDAPTTVQVTTAPLPEGVDGTEIETSEPEPITAPTAEPETTTTYPPTTVPWWERRFEMVTRPPLPKLFSASSFNIDFKVTQEMSPSCRLLVYYIRHRETIADSTTVDVASTFANKVSMEFNEEEVSPGSNVKLTLKASPGSVFAIAAVDKSVHFLADANDIKTNQVTQILKNLDVGPGHINDAGRCGKSDYWWYPRSDDYVDSQKAFNDNGMVFLTNLWVDTRPCNDAPIALPMLVDSVAERVEVDEGPGMESSQALPF